MSLKRIFAYALAGDEHSRGGDSGFVGTVIECVEEKSLNPFRRYSLQLRKKIMKERLRELYEEQYKRDW